MTAPLSNRETDDSYNGVLARHDRFRVIVCSDGLQWIAQRRKSGSGGRWVALGYFRSRDTLLRLWTGLECPVAPELAQLPRTFRGSTHD